VPGGGEYSAAMMGGGGGGFGAGGSGGAGLPRGGWSGFELSVLSHSVSANRLKGE